MPDQHGGGIAGTGKIRDGVGREPTLVETGPRMIFGGWRRTDPIMPGHIPDETKTDRISENCVPTSTVLMVQETVAR